MLIQDDNMKVIALVKFCFMFPVPPNLIKIKDFVRIRQVDPTYADLLEKELKFCQKNEKIILQKALNIYKIGCKKTCFKLFLL